MQLKLENEIQSHEKLTQVLNEKIKSSEENYKSLQILNASLVEKSEKENLEKVRIKAKKYNFQISQNKKKKKIQSRFFFCHQEICFKIVLINIS